MLLGNSVGDSLGSGVGSPLGVLLGKMLGDTLGVEVGVVGMLLGMRVGVKQQRQSEAGVGCCDDVLFAPAPAMVIPSSTPPSTSSKSW